MNAYFELSRDRNFILHFATEKNNSIEPHYHSNIEIVYVLEGEIEICIREQNKLLKAGEFSVADSYDVHSYVTPEYSLVKILIIPIELAGSFLRLSEGKTFASPFLTDHSFTGPISDAFHGLEQLDSSGKSLAVKGYLYVILGLLADGLTLSSSSKASGALGPIRNMLIYLDLNFREPIQISELAKKFGYNKDYLSRMFNATLGCRFKYYLNLLRARNAANLILNSNESISEIAYNSGFSSQRTFNRTFKDLYGITPVEYKYQNANKKEI